jgi:hypothetical protein
MYERSVENRQIRLTEERRRNAIPTNLVFALPASQIPSAALAECDLDGNGVINYRWSEPLGAGELGNKYVNEYRQAAVGPEIEAYIAWLSRNWKPRTFPVQTPEPAPTVAVASEALPDAASSRSTGLPVTTIRNSPSRDASPNRSPSTYGDPEIDRVMQKARDESVIPKDESIKEGLKWLIEPAVDNWKNRNR